MRPAGGEWKASRRDARALTAQPRPSRFSMSAKRFSCFSMMTIHPALQPPLLLFLRRAGLSARHLEKVVPSCPSCIQNHCRKLLELSDNLFPSASLPLFHVRGAVFMVFNVGIPPAPFAALADFARDILPPSTRSPSAPALLSTESDKRHRKLVPRTRGSLGELAPPNRPQGAPQTRHSQLLIARPESGLSFLPLHRRCPTTRSRGSATLPLRSPRGATVFFVKSQLATAQCFLESTYTMKYNVLS